MVYTGTHVHGAAQVHGGPFECQNVDMAEKASTAALDTLSSTAVVYTITHQGQLLLTDPTRVVDYRWARPRQRREPPGDDHTPSYRA